MIQTKINKLLHTFIACRIYRLQSCSICEKTFTLNLGLCKNLKWVLKSHSCTQTHTHTHRHTHTHTHTHAHTHTHTHTHASKHTHIHLHTKNTHTGSCAMPIMHVHYHLGLLHHTHSNISESLLVFVQYGKCFFCSNQLTMVFPLCMVETLQQFL